MVSGLFVRFPSNTQERNEALLTVIYIQALSLLRCYFNINTIYERNIIFMLASFTANVNVLEFLLLSWGEASARLQDKGLFSLLMHP